MPGKFTQIEAWTDMSAFHGPVQRIPEGAPSRSAQPMWQARIIRLGEDGRPELVKMRWAFSKAGEIPAKAGHMHARGETVDSLPRFCDAFGERRGVLMVETFNVKKTIAEGKTEQWVVRPKDRLPLALAVIWEEFEDRTGPVPAFCMITVPANKVLTPFEDRMPAILEQKDWPVWLGEVDAPFREIKALLRTFDDNGNWEMAPQAAKKKDGGAPAPPKPPQMDLF